MKVHNWLTDWLTDWLWWRGRQLTARDVCSQYLYTEQDSDWPSPISMHPTVTLDWQTLWTMYNLVYRSRSGFKIAEWSGNVARKHSRKPKRRTSRRSVKRLPPAARVRRRRANWRTRHTTASWPDSRPPPAGVWVLPPRTATPPALWPQPPISCWSKTSRHKARAPECTICTTTTCRTIIDVSACKMAARFSIDPTLSEPCRLLNYAQASERSLRDGAVDDCRLFPIYVYRRITIQPPLLSPISTTQKNLLLRKFVMWLSLTTLVWIQWQRDWSVIQGGKQKDET